MSVLTLDQVLKDPESLPLDGGGQAQLMYYFHFARGSQGGK